MNMKREEVKIKRGRKGKRFKRGYTVKVTFKKNAFHHFKAQKNTSRNGSDTLVSISPGYFCCKTFLKGSDTFKMFSV